jgi:SPX domain protein involved in polyphosphate accumulation
MGAEMAKTTKRRSWTKEDVRTLKMLAREQTKTTVIARKLKRSVAAVYLRASKLAVALGGGGPFNSEVQREDFWR